MKRRWGEWTVLEKGKNCRVIRLTVKPDSELSLQKHLFREEVWIIVSGEALVRLNEKNLSLKSGDVLNIRREDVHQLINSGKEKLCVIEAQIGETLSLNDIERLTLNKNNKKA